MEVKTIMMMLHTSYAYTLHHQHHITLKWFSQGTFLYNNYSSDTLVIIIAMLFEKKQERGNIVISSICPSITRSLPKWLCRNSPNLVVMITCHRGAQYQKMQQRAPFKTLFNGNYIWINIGGCTKYLMIFWIWPLVHAPGGGDWGSQDSKRKKKL